MNDINFYPQTLAVNVPVNAAFTTAAHPDNVGTFLVVEHIKVSFSAPVVILTDTTITSLP